MRKDTPTSEPAPFPQPSEHPISPAGAGPGRVFQPGRPLTHLSLFFATTVTVYFSTRPSNPLAFFATGSVFESMSFMCAVMAILLAHELGHYLAGRFHGIELTLPYFIPVPFAFGTMGAVIRMKQIRRRGHLLDVGAAGPLAGLAVALPLAIAGIALSRVEIVPEGPNIMLGDSLLFGAIVKAIHGSLAEGYDVFLHPIGLAAWFGFLVTSLNLMPASQLDGGHITKALFGRFHLFLSRFVFLALSAWGALGDAFLVDPRMAITGVLYLLGAVAVLFFKPAAKSGRRILLVLFAAHLFLSVFLEADTVSFPWLLWSVLLFVFRLQHPPVADQEAPLSPARRAVGWLCLLLFVATFTPIPISLTGF